MRTLHIPNGDVYVEIPWEGSAEELEALIKGEQAELKTWKKLLKGSNGKFLQRKFPEFPIFEQLPIEVGFDPAETPEGEIVISDADGSFDTFEDLNGYDPIEKFCSAVLIDDEWHIRIETRDTDEYGRGLYSYENCCMPMDDFCAALHGLAEAVAADSQKKTPEMR